MTAADGQDKTMLQLFCPQCGKAYSDGSLSCPDDGSTLSLTPADATSLAPGTLFAGRFEINQLLGKGGMGHVYDAHHRFMNVDVAVKIMPKERMDQEAFLRFQQEARAASSLKHDNVAVVHDFGIADNGQPYLVMDLVRGISLAEEIEKTGRIEIHRAVEIFIQCCDAMAHAHQKNVIHRDLKPSNIMLCRGEDDKEYVKIVDFGIAKIRYPDGEQEQGLTRDGEVFGSPFYMSPEQCAGKPLDQRSDIYSLGCVMYEALSGFVPHEGENTIETLYSHLNAEPRPLSEVGKDLRIPYVLEHIVHKALSKAPEQRYQSMKDLMEALIDAQDSLDQTSAVSPRRIWRRLRRSRTVRVAGASVLGVLLVVGIVAGGIAKTHADAMRNLSNDYVLPADELEADGKIQSAEENYQKALAYAQTVPVGEHIQAMVLARVSLFYKREHRFVDAEQAALRSLELRRKSIFRDQSAIAESLMNLGFLYEAMKQPAKSAEYFAEAASLYQSLGAQFTDKRIDCLKELREAYDIAGDNRFQSVSSELRSLGVR